MQLPAASDTAAAHPSVTFSDQLSERCPSVNFGNLWGSWTESSLQALSRVALPRQQDQPGSEEKPVTGLQGGLSMLVRHLFRRSASVVTHLLPKHLSASPLIAVPICDPLIPLITPICSSLAFSRGFAATALEEPAREDASSAALTKDDARSILQAGPLFGRLGSATIRKQPVFSMPLKPLHYAERQSPAVPAAPDPD